MRDIVKKKKNGCSQRLDRCHSTFFFFVIFFTLFGENGILDGIGMALMGMGMHPKCPNGTKKSVWLKMWIREKKTKEPSDIMLTTT
jgi:hypothetical protein